MYFQPRFNTSHVTLYRWKTGSCNICDDVSIHLMLLFISITLCHTQTKSSFNTSHVTLYQWNPKTLPQSKHVSIHLMLLFILKENMFLIHGLQFQYISCYSLSTMLAMSLMVLREFQYISCYSLSPCCL